MALGVFGAFKGIDAFGRTSEDVKVKTRTGALLTLVSAIFIATFTLVEFVDFRKIHVDTAIVVDRSRGEKLQVVFNMTFPRVPCYLLNLDVTDISGEVVRDITHHVVKTRLDPSALMPIHDGLYRTGLENEVDKQLAAKGPNYCGSCYGGLEPVSGCCNTCDEVRQAYSDRGWAFGNPDAIDQCVSEHWTDKVQAMQNEGCNIEGRVRVNKVTGNIQFSPGRSFVVNRPEVFQMVPYLQNANHYFGHWIHSMEIYDYDEDTWTRQHLPEHIRERLGIARSPLEEVYAHTDNAEYMFQYFLKVVKNTYKSLNGETYKTHQYSTSSYERDLATLSRGKNEDGIDIVHERLGVPGAFFNFDISSMEVVHIEQKQSWAHFITSMAAIIGGVLTVASLADALLFNTQGLIKKGAAAVAAEGKQPYQPTPSVKIM
ncbi:hypothetical protein M408DRAFT_329198 [Serendipita vermifera MAFF 305830]|uniref:Endoplasmic reticulum vesicle transporter C-terminal domain-containing protein n=1 Tax=Serendipita vermifera MAFF 305830 TaxID=933852 RepID=A0A0C3B9F9_SERVB|nr:hypothetical protein M408DRAFT_329198 [Serendipita vermifera MAFF 305830]